MLIPPTSTLIYDIDDVNITRHARRPPAFATQRLWPGPYKDSLASSCSKPVLRVTEEKTHCMDLTIYMPTSLGVNLLPL